jgi:hypothetical protein
MNALRVRSFACLAALVLLAGCQGNVGSSYPSASLPQLSPNPGQYPGGGLRQSRSVAANSSLKAEDDGLDFPAVDGFGLRLVLRESAAPSPLPAAGGATPSPAPSAATGGPRSGVGAFARPSASLEPAASPVPGSPAPAASAAAPRSPSPAPSASGAAAKAELKLTTYPENAPDLPATAGVAPRRALARGYLVVQRDLTIAGPGAFEFVLPPAERTAERAFTIALYESLKRNRLKLVAQDAAAALLGDRVRGGAAGGQAPLLLRRGRGYAAILYAADAAPAALPAAAGGGATPAPNPSGTAAVSGSQPQASPSPLASQPSGMPH